MQPGWGGWRPHGVSVGRPLCFFKRIGVFKLFLGNYPNASEHQESKRTSEQKTFNNELNPFRKTTHLSRKTTRGHTTHIDIRDHAQRPMHVPGERCGRAGAGGPAPSAWRPDAPVNSVTAPGNAPVVGTEGHVHHGFWQKRMTGLRSATDMKGSS